MSISQSIINLVIKLSENYLEALEFLPSKAVSGQSCALKPVSDVAEIRNPAQVDRYRVKTDKEPREQQERHRHNRSQKHSIL